MPPGDHYGDAGATNQNNTYRYLPLLQAIITETLEGGEGQALQGVRSIAGIYGYLEKTLIPAVRV